MCASNANLDVRGPPFASMCAKAQGISTITTQLGRRPCGGDEVARPAPTA
jgi:hypothetical protein